MTHPDIPMFDEEEGKFKGWLTGTDAQLSVLIIMLRTYHVVYVRIDAFTFDAGGYRYGTATWFTMTCELDNWEKKTINGPVSEGRTKYHL